MLRGERRGHGPPARLYYRAAAATRDKTGRQIRPGRSKLGRA